jgi:hypothetical protein
MAPYFEIYTDSSKERKLSPGDKVVLLDSKSAHKESVKASVRVKIVSDSRAKVLVKTTDSNYEPGLEKGEKVPNSVWVGPVFRPQDLDGIRLRRQKTFPVNEHTIFTTGSKMVVWREK